MSLHNKAMLVALNIRGWRASKKDPKATREVHEKHQAKDAGVFRKHLIDPTALKQIQQASNEARAYHYEHTLPWGEQGFRILTAEGKPDYDAKMRTLKDAYCFQVEQFLRTYPKEIEKAKAQLNGLFNAAEYPDVADLRTRFEFKTNVMPIPHVDDFRIQLAQQDMSDLKADLARQLETFSLDAQRSLWQRLHDALNLVHETLKNPERRWIKRTFTKLDEMADIIAKLNYSGNQELNELAYEAKNRFAQLDLQHCKSTPGTRKAAAHEASALLDKVSKFI